MKRIRFFDANGRVIYSVSLAALPLADDAVVAKSVELYRDNAPCPVRRGCVCDVIRTMLDGDVALDAFLRKAVNLPGAVRSETYED